MKQEDVKQILTVKEFIYVSMLEDNFKANVNIKVLNYLIENKPCEFKVLKIESENRIILEVL